jgi:hypothetical protein
MTAIPGPGVLMMQVYNEGPTIGGVRFSPYRTARFSAEDLPKIKPYRAGREGFYAAGDTIEFLDQIQNAAKYVNFAEGSQPQTIDLTLDRGKTVEIEIVDPAGQPVANAFVSGITEQWPIAARLGKPRQAIYALGADAPRRVVLLQADRKLAGRVELTGDERSPVRVPLGQVGSVRGRALDESGQPLAGLPVNVIFEHLSASELYRFHDIDKQRATTDADGRFTVDNLLPDEDFYINLQPTGTYLRPKPNGAKQVKSGQTLDLGEVTFVSR